MTSGERRWGVTLVLAVALLVMLVAGGGELSTPPAAGWRALDAWYAEVGAAAASLALVRVVALAGGAWLVVTAAAQVLTSRAPLVRWRRWADAVTPAAVRRAVEVSLRASLVVPVVSAAPLDDPDGRAVMEQLEDARPPTTTSTTDAPAAATPAPPLAPHAAAGAPGPDRVVVRPGDSFWRLAEEAVGEAGGERPQEHEVARYWRRLVEVNRAVLVDDRNPDLLYPGQTLVLPPP